MKNYNLFHILCFTFLLAFSSAAFAQGGGIRFESAGRGNHPAAMQAAQMRPDMNKFAFISGEVVFSPEEKGGEETPGVGTTVIVIPIKETVDSTKRKAKVTSSAVDTLFATVGSTGKFFMRNVPVGKAVVTFTMMGYEDITKTVSINPGNNPIIANLKPSSYSLDAAVVKEQVPPISISGDTLVFHAAAVKTNKGEMAIDVLEQMPGVEVGESGVKVQNESVQNVYVDGALLFGSAPMKALNNLPAEEVVTIKSYQEYENKDPRHKISKTESKQRVLDIQTKSKPKFVTNGDFLAGGGFDTDSTYHKFRYTLGGEVFAASEKLQAHASYNMNNINNGSNRRRGNSFGSAGGGGAADLRALNLNVGVTKKWMSPTTKNFVLGTVNGNYSYSNTYNVTESITQRIYFPTDDYQSRIYNGTSFSAATSKTHNFSVNGLKNIGDGNVRASVSYSIRDNINESRSTSYNTQDDLAPQGTSSSTHRTTEGGSLDLNLGADKGFADFVRLGLDANFSNSASDGNTIKIDTTTSTITCKTLQTDAGSDSRNFSLSPNLRFELGEKSALSLGYSYNNSYNKSEQWAYDITDPEIRGLIDTVNTEILTNSTNTHSATLNYMLTFGKSDVMLHAGLSYNSTGLNRTDEFPEIDPYERRWNAFRPRISLGTQSNVDNWNLSYSMSTNAPSLEQVRPKLNNNNLYNVSGGNPNLNQSKSHSFEGRFSTVLGKEARASLKAAKNGTPTFDTYTGNVSTLNVNAGFSMRNDLIVSKKTYYAKQTYLEDYDYMMPAQSTFTSYENADHAYSANLNVSYGTPLNFIMCMLNTSASMNWDNTPSYLNGDLIRTTNMAPTLNIGLRSNFSRTVRFNVNGRGSYIYSINDNNDKTSYFTETINVGFEVNNILKHGYAGGNYNKSFFQKIDRKGTNDNILNARAGMRFGPRNNIDISVAVNDIFNRTSGFSRTTNVDFVSNSWVHNFGRYVMFTLTYRFTSMGKGGSGFGPGMGGPGMGGPGMMRGMHNMGPTSFMH
ncbi:MAG: TonB-dependent receptor [Bacteroidales bacterium]|nr:TonB-dependent receptor [Bacteroidales bacterium]